MYFRKKCKFASPWALMLSQRAHVSALHHLCSSKEHVCSSPYDDTLDPSKYLECKLVDITSFPIIDDGDSNKLLTPYNINLECHEYNTYIQSYAHIFEDVYSRTTEHCDRITNNNKWEPNLDNKNNANVDNKLASLPPTPKTPLGHSPPLAPSWTSNPITLAQLVQRWSVLQIHYLLTSFLDVDIQTTTNLVFMLFKLPIIEPTSFDTNGSINTCVVLKKPQYNFQIVMLIHEIPSQILNIPCH